LWQCKAEIRCIFEETKSLTKAVTAQKKMVFSEFEQLKKEA